MHKKIAARATVFLVMVVFFTCNACSEKQGSEPELTVTGKIVYVNRIDGFMLKGEEPPEEFIIANPDAPFLQDLVDEDETVVVEGYTKGGADMLYIEKINGKPYKVLE